MRKQLCICDLCKKEVDPTEVIRIYIAYRNRPTPEYETSIEDVCSDCEIAVRSGFNKVLALLNTYE